ncbi:hypothetical protein Asi03nite_21920 [Actinoplanes siamensis]|uniref:RHS repeat-associated protein n=1 Tax=Actinoplanes siamensis TaxID=1223317 RepID=A0A919N582_9ACTN|nr:hypothetical protein Asi03nite_21920 [Actinoplanes siamensis]
MPSLPAAAAEAKPKAPACPSSLADESAALITARLCGGRILVANATTETSTTWANADGTLTSQIFAGPQHVKQGNKWVDINSVLQPKADGTVQATVPSSDLALFGGDTPASAGKSGDRPLVHAKRPGGEELTLGWRSKLPKPVLQDDTATYRDVTQGTDVQVQLTATGFQQHMVLKQKPSTPISYTVPLRLTGLTARKAAAGGGAEFVDKAGKVVGTMAAPSMWDSDLDAVSQLPTHTANVSFTLTPRDYGVDVTLEPDMKFLADPATKYPVTVDPDVSLHGTFDTYVRNGMTTDGSTSTELVVGTDASGNPARSFINWDPAPLRGKQIVEAHMGLWNSYSSTCAIRAINIHSAGLASAATRWTAQPTVAATKSGATDGTMAGPSCAEEGYIRTPDHGLDQLAQTWANTTSGQVGMALIAPSETDVRYFKRLRSGNATSGQPWMYVTYNSYPVLGARSTSPSSSCVTGAGRPYINSATPTLKAVVSDAETSPVAGVFEWYAVGGAKIGGTTTATAASGATVSAAVPAGAFGNGSSYSWRVAGNDGTVNGTWSSYCEFTIDTTAPTAVPTVSSSTFPAGGGGGNAGAPGAFSFAANGVSDVAAFLYGLDTNPPTTVVNASSIGGSASVSITPATAGDHTLYVRSRDRAGNLSAITSYVFTVGSALGAISSPMENDLSAGVAVLSSTGGSTSTGVTYQWRRSETDAWTTIPTGNVTTTSGGAVSWPVTTSGSGTFPPLNWNVETTVNAAEAGPDALDGPLQVRASFSGGTAGQSQPVRFELDRSRAQAPTSSIGPAEVNLLTGNAMVPENDASAAGGLGVTRVYNTRQSGVSDALFGPGWVSSLKVPTGDTYRNVTVTGSLVQVGLPDGGTLGFTKKATTSTGATFEGEADSADLALEYFSASNSYVLTGQDGDSTTFTRSSTDPAGVYTPSSSVTGGTGASTAITWQNTTVSGSTVVRPVRAVAPAPAGVSCSSSPLTTRGCKTLTYTYATSTTATASVPGDYLGRVKELAYTAYNPATSTMTTIVLARYSYDTNGRLNAAWDPRLDYAGLNGTEHQATTYAYDTDGILNTVTPQGELPWQLSYTTVPGDAGKGRINKISRSALSAGNAVATVVYKVPTTGSSAPFDLSAGNTARWGQSVTPVDATAVFPATQVPGGNQATGALPSNWEHATVTYLDGNARETNILEPGQHLSATWYDAYGNMVQELSPLNLDRALWASASDTASAEATLAANLSAITQYSSDGQRVTDEFGPEHDVSLNDRSEVRGRSHTKYTYDQDAPASGESYDLVTTQVESVRYWDSKGKAVDADSQATRTYYDWDLRQPISTVVDPDGLALTTRATYDSVTGQTSSTTLPAGDGSTAATRKVVYYRAGTGSGVDECDNTPEWAGLACLVTPAAQADSGSELPETLTSYNMFGQPVKTVERNSSGTVRTTTITYDAAGRPATQTVSGDSSLGTAVGTRRLVYDAASGQPVRTEQLNTSGTVVAQVTRAYDTLGRVTSYTDADGAVTTRTYDIASREVSVSNGKGTQTYTYDNRGLIINVTDSQAGTFAGTYDSDGQLRSEVRPDGVVVKHYYAEDGVKNGIQYEESNGTEIYGDWTGVDAHGRTRWYVDTMSSSGYAYDNAGRLVEADQSVSTQGCFVRFYNHDKNSNRTSQSTYNAAADGSCQYSNVANTQDWSYDSADRVTNTGYNYDNLGRTLTVPGADTTGGSGAVTLDYYTNDMTRAITRGQASNTNELDVLTNRFRSSTTADNGTTATSINHYSDDTDNPSWTASTSGYTRVISGLDGLAAIYNSAGSTVLWQITNLHGDVVATRVNGTVGLTATYVTDDYGVPVTGTSPKYGYLGNEQRAADNTGGFISMGVRTYNPTTGRFLSVDPIYGGNANPYDYCSGDPANCSDISGQWSVQCKWQKKRYAHVPAGWAYNFQARCDVGHRTIRAITSAGNVLLAGLVGSAIAALFGGVTIPVAIELGFMATFVYIINEEIKGSYGDYCKRNRGAYIVSHIWNNTNGHTLFKRKRVTFWGCR